MEHRHLRSATQSGTRFGSQPSVRQRVQVKLPSPPAQAVYSRSPFVPMPGSNRVKLQLVQTPSISQAFA